MVQEYIDAFQNYIVVNREYLATFVTLSVGMAMIVYYWIRSEVEELSTEDRKAIFWLGSVFVIPVLFSVVAALIILGLLKFFKFLFAL